MGSIASVLQWHCDSCTSINPTERVTCLRCGKARVLGSSQDETTESAVGSESLNSWSSVFIEDTIVWVIIFIVLLLYYHLVGTKLYITDSQSLKKSFTITILSSSHHHFYHGSKTLLLPWFLRGSGILIFHFRILPDVTVTFDRFSILQDSLILSIPWTVKRPPLMYLFLWQRKKFIILQFFYSLFLQNSWCINYLFLF